MQDATALAAAIRDGKVTVTDVMEASLAACDAQAQLGAVVHVDRTTARAAAAAAEVTPPARRGPFHGIPFLAKDLGARANGLPASAGSAALRTAAIVPRADDDLFTVFRASGLLAFGLTATPPFGSSLSCEAEGLPPTRNPWNLALTPGGSSGGAAAAVAAGIVAMAHATDAAGSIRVPAACCGLTGLKPSRGAVPGGPDFGNHLMGIASELVLARSVRDVAGAFEAVRRQPLSVPLSDPPRIGFALPEGCGPDQHRVVVAIADALRDAGCQVCEVPSPDAAGAQAHQIAWIVLTVSLAAWLTALDLADDQVPPLAAALAAEGRGVPATKLFDVTRDMARLTHETSTFYAHFDALLLPVLSGPPVPVGSFTLSAGDPEDHRVRMAAFAPNAALANVAGLSALALPFGTSGGLPLGAQLLGPIGGDAALLALGAMIEARAPALTFPGPIAGIPT